MRAALHAGGGRCALPGAAGILTLEILDDRRRKWGEYITALRSFPGRVLVRPRPEFDADVFAVWGACGYQQWAALRRYRESGRPVICLDVGYFNRNQELGADRQCKIALNDPHPQALPPAPDNDRFDRLGIALRDISDPRGPTVIAGLGIKTRRWLANSAAPRWESAMLNAIRTRWPGRRIVYRPKSKRPESLPGAVTMGRDRYSIEQVLPGASLVVSRHSNVCAVDAALLGVPAVVETGPGVNLWPRDLRITHPDHDRRLDYLRRLAWWSWSLAELRRGEHWDWVLSQCN